jgi:hypothetical protein
MPIFRSTPYTIVSSQLLTNAFVDTQVIDVEGFSDLLVLVDYTTGAAETNNVVNIKVKTSSGDRDTTTGRQTESDKYVVTLGTPSTGTVTLNDVIYQYTGAGAATAYKFAFSITAADDFLTLSVEETGVASNYGNVTIKVVKVNKYQ